MEYHVATLKKKIDVWPDECGVFFPTYRTDQFWPLGPKPIPSLSVVYIVQPSAFPGGACTNLWACKGPQSLQYSFDKFIMIMAHKSSQTPGRFSALCLRGPVATDPRVVVEDGCRTGVGEQVTVFKLSVWLFMKWTLLLFSFKSIVELKNLICTIIRTKQTCLCGLWHWRTQLSTGNVKLHFSWGKKIAACRTVPETT